MKFAKLYAVICFLIIALTGMVACTGQEEMPVETAVAQVSPTILPTHTAVPPTATHTPTPLPTATTTPRPTSTATATPVIPHLYARGAHISIGDWSPDSQWLPYWLSTAEDLAGLDGYTYPGGTLHLLHSGSKESCALTQFQRAPGGQMSLAWHEDNSLIVLDREREVQWQGQPCQPDSFVQLAEPLPPPADHYESRRVSPDGRFQVTLQLVDEEADHWRTLLTTIRDETGAEVTAVTWRTQATFEEGDPGGEWLSPTQFFIHYTDNGPLLLNVNRPGQVVNVQGDLFGLSWPAADMGLHTVPGPTPDSFYLALFRGRFTGQVRLYHASSGLVETLPHQLWSTVSPDRQWLLMYGNGADMWMRRLADVEGEWQLLAEDIGGYRWNDDGTEITISEFQQITWQTFPEGEIIGQWSVAPLHTFVRSWYRWSPDGRFLAATAATEDMSWYTHALFLFDRHSD